MVASLSAYRGQTVRDPGRALAFYANDRECRRPAGARASTEAFRFAGAINVWQRANVRSLQASAKTNLSVLPLGSLRLYLRRYLSEPSREPSPSEAYLGLRPYLARKAPHHRAAYPPQTLGQWTTASTYLDGHHRRERRSSVTASRPANSTR